MVTSVAVAKVHDLVELSSTAVTELCGQAAQEGEDWVAEALSHSVWAVVRRARPVHKENIAIGLRGPKRSQRWASEIPADDTHRVLSPRDLAYRGVPRRHLPAFQALSLLQSPSFRVPVPGDWGPGGSVGAELASGVETVHVDSDLDLVVRMTDLADPETLESIASTVKAVSEKAGTRIDVLLETPCGGINLEELVAAIPGVAGLNGGPVVARTADGPELFHPWSAT